MKFNYLVNKKQTIEVSENEIRNKINWEKQNIVS